MHLAHTKYSAHRLSLLTPGDHATITTEHPHFIKALTSTGVAGIDYKTNPGRVKCLHAHAAHFLSGGPGSEENCVGRWTVEWCEELELIKTATVAKDAN